MIQTKKNVQRKTEIMKDQILENYKAVTGVEEVPEYIREIAEIFIPLVGEKRQVVCLGDIWKSVGYSEEKKAREFLTNHPQDFKKGENADYSIFTNSEFQKFSSPNVPRQKKFLSPNVSQWKTNGVEATERNML